MTRPNLHIIVREEALFDGCVVFYDWDGKAVALRLPGSNGTVVDLREEPPFTELSPCPYCYSSNHRHVLSFHIDHSLGVVNETETSGTR